MSHLRLWLLAARPRTLPAAVAPVLVGTALAGSEDEFRALPFVAALIGSVFIQIGTNLSNDYSDARRGADTEDRLGPVRVTAGGLMPPRRVLVGTYVAFGVAVAAGLYLAAVAGWELLVVGAASILAGVLYTGGPRPYGYEGLGELFVFLFFGIVAVVGSYFVQTEELRWEAFALAVPVGLLASAILVVNNVRDIDTDRRAGKRTLAVKLGRERARVLFAAMVIVSFAVPPLLVPALSPWVLLTLAALPLVPALLRTVATRVGRPGAQRCARRRGQAAGRLLGAAGRRSAALVKRSILRLSIPLKTPFVTAAGVTDARELLLLRLEAADGTVGYGEAAPFEPYDGVPLERALAALTGGAGRRPPQARAAEEVAKLDLLARQEGRPVAEPARDALPVNMTLPAGPPEETAARAREGMREGFASFKLKVGLPDDAERVAAVREAVGPWPALRLDANGVWAVDDAVRAIRAMEQHDLEFVEQPCQRLRELAEVRQRVSTPIASRRVGRLDARTAARARARRLRRRQREAGGRGWLHARPRTAARGARARSRRLSVEHARRSLGYRGGSPTRGLGRALAGLRPRHPRALRRPHRARPAGTAPRDTARPGRAGPGRPGGPGGPRRGDGRGRGLAGLSQHSTTLPRTLLEVARRH